MGRLRHAGEFDAVFRQRLNGLFPGGFRYRFLRPERSSFACLQQLPSGNEANRGLNLLRQFPDVIECHWFIHQHIFARFHGDEPSEPADIGLTRRHHSRWPAACLRTEAHYRRLGRLLAQFFAEHKISSVISFEQASAWHEHAFERGHKSSRLGVVRSVLGRIQELLSFRLAGKEPESRDLINRIGIGRVRRIKPKRRYGSRPVLVIELAQVNDRGPPGVVSHHRKLRIALV